MTEPVLLDTGPIVSLLSSADAHHDRCVSLLRTLKRPPITCWPVLTEAAWLLRESAGSVAKLLAHIHHGAFELAELHAESGEWLAAFITRYRDLPAQLADAALVYLAEVRGLNTVFTLDRRDFSVYRTGGGRSLHILPEL